MISLKYICIATGIHILIDYYSIYHLYIYINQLKNNNTTNIQRLQTLLDISTLECNKIKLKYNLLKSQDNAVVNVNNAVVNVNNAVVNVNNAVVNNTVVDNAVTDNAVTDNAVTDNAVTDNAVVDIEVILNDIINTIINESGNSTQNPTITYIPKIPETIQKIFEYDHIDKCYLVGNNVPTDIHIKNNNSGLKDIKNVSVSCVNWVIKWIKQQ
jgi:hypothetical protein